MKARVKIKKYIFSFEGGGFNFVFAKTKRSAYTKAVKEWEDGDKLVVRKDSIVLCTEEIERSAMSLFY